MAKAKNSKDKRLGVAEGKRQYDLPLNKSIGTGFLVLLIALMSFLAVMALATSFALGSMTERWSSGLENKATIEIPAETETGDLRSNDQINILSAEVVEKLIALPQVKTIAPLPEEEIKQLIEPWLGEGAIMNDIPLPGLLSLELENSEPESIIAIRKALSSINEDIKLDTHESWLGDLLRLTGALQFAAAFVLLIIGITTVAAVAGAIRTRMAVHSEEVELLHLMGASDDYITRQLQRHALIIGLKGSLAGLVAAACVLTIIALISGETAAALLPDFQINIFHIAGLIIIPVLICFIASLAARFTVLRVLALMP